jgi:phospholipid/cholesterol/gamma-HCH transport system substrate-binding protein
VVRNTGKYTLILGVFIIFGVALLLAGIYFVGQKQKLFSNIFRIHGIFENVSGLQAGNNVRFSGITVGTVESIEIIADTAVKVEMIIEEETRRFIKKDAVAIIGSDGLMGNRIINIVPGTSSEEEIKSNDKIATSRPPDMDEIWTQLKKTSDNAAAITSDLAAIVGTIRSGKGTVGKLFMDSTFATSIDQTLVTVKKGAKGFEENMDAAKHSFLLKGIFKRKKKKRDQKK